MMIDFVIAVLCTLFVLYLPGMLLVMSFRVKPIFSFAVAPIVSIVCYELISIALSLVGVSYSWTVSFVPLSCVAAACFVISLAVFRRKSDVANGWSKTKITTREWMTFCLYIAMGLAVGVYIFVSVIDVDLSFMQAWDNAWHISLIRTFLDTGVYSPLVTTAYPDSASPLDGSTSSFYPAAWHLIAAMIVDLTQCPITLSANAVNYVFATVVYPSGVYVLLSVLFGNDTKKLFWGSLASIAFAAFPWLLLTFGPLFPNLASLALMPVVSALFISLFEKGSRKPVRAIRFALFIMGGVALALVQPNTVFSCAVFLAPFCIYEIVKSVYERCGGGGKGVVFSAAAGLVFFIFVATIWVALHGASFMQSTVTFNWASYASKSQAVINALSLGYVNLLAAQPLLATFVLLGVLYTLYQKKYLWISVSYLVICVILCAVACSDGAIKSLLAGFWYTDGQRIAATAAIIATPLACLGMASIAKLASRLFAFAVGKAPSLHDSKVFCFAAYAFMALIILYPNFTLPGYGDIQTSFGKVRTTMDASYSLESNVLDEKEISFLEEVSEAVSEGELILNQPHDGSVFAYGLYGLDVYYRTFGNEWAEAESAESELTRLGIDDYTEEPDVREAMSEIGARYVLVLGQDNEDEYYLGSYLENDWTGINDITDETPGFEIVLAEDDMRLYRITD